MFKLFDLFRLGSKRDVSRVHLTKTNYVAGLQCPLRLWARWHDPLPKAERVETAAMRTGNRVGKGAHALFLAGVLVDTLDHQRALDKTRKLMASESVPAIFEAALEHGNVRVRVDVLERAADGAWIINEVKSSTEVKDEHIPDAAIQVWAARGMGLKVPEVNVIRVDASYVRGPSSIEWARLLVRDNVTAQVSSHLKGLSRNLEEQFAVLAGPRPHIEPSPHCERPYTCEFWQRCTGRKPEDWIFHLPRIKADLFADLNRAGVERIGDIPGDVTLNELQSHVRDCHRSNTPYVSPRLAQAIRPIAGEAWYFDVETVAPAVPLWPGTRPYQRVPFQWSLHHRSATGQLQHIEFLAEGPDDPRRAFAERLLAAVGSGDAPVVVYSAYERLVIDDLERIFPDLSAPLLALRGRLFDLLPVIREHYYHPGFRGSFSIKAVGPTLAPEVDYAGLEGIAKGDEASEAFERLVAMELRPDESARGIRHDLLAYCKLDTLALLRVQEGLANAAAQGQGGLDL